MKSNKHIQEKGREPQTYTDAEDAITTEERSLDIAQSGQFAPGGYYKQQQVNVAARRRLDEDIVPPARL